MAPLLAQVLLTLFAFHPSTAVASPAGLICPPLHQLTDRHTDWHIDRQEACVHLSVKPIRKLHLVRPDLIAYPINYAVYC